MHLSLKRVLGGIAVAFAILVNPAVAQEVSVGGDFIPLVKDKPYLHVVHEGRSIKVQRVQDPDYELKGYFAKTARKCPPFCIQPMIPDPRVLPIGEVELFEFMESDLRDGTGALIDARTPSWFKKGTIPGSVNYPFNVITKGIDDPDVLDILEELGARERDEVGFATSLAEDWGVVDAKYKTKTWDFTQAKDLVLWCNGPACGQSPRAIRGLLEMGYPAEKIRYYRGGMQMWQLWGLTTVVPRQ